MRSSRPRYRLTALLCTACADFVAHSGPARPDAELAVLTCYTRYYLVYSDECHVGAVAAQQPATSQLVKGMIEIGETTVAGDRPAHRADAVCRFGG